MTKLYNDELHLSESQTTIFAALCELSDIVITTFGKPHAPSDAHLRETYAGICGLGWLSWYSDSQRAGLSGDRIPVGGEKFLTSPDSPWGLPSFLYNMNRVIPRGKSAGTWR
jgi:hypothetical protein